MVDPTTALSTHLSETIRTFLPDLLGRQQTKELVDRVGQTSPKLIEELVPKLVSIGDIQRVLRQLLRERVPVRDLTTILEAIGDAVGARCSKDTGRDHRGGAHRAWAGRFAGRIQNERGELPTISLAPALEAQLVSCDRAHRAGRGAGARPDARAATGDAGRRGARAARWHNPCSCARRHCVRICGGC